MPSKPPAKILYVRITDEELAHQVERAVAAFGITYQELVTRALRHLLFSSPAGPVS